MNLSQALNRASESLKSAGIKNHWGESLILLCSVTGLSREKIFAYPERELTPEEKNKFIEKLEKRCSRYPLQYLVNNVEFYSLNFYIEDGIFIPRQETEILVEGASDIINSGKIKSFVEIGIGSGAVSITLMKMNKKIVCIGTDLLKKAVEIARKNARIHNVENRIELVQADLLSCFRNSSLELIISNPPYVAKGDTTSPEVAYEPDAALYSESQGLEIIFRLLEDSLRVLKTGGWVILEVGDGQIEMVKTFLEKNFSKIRILRDYSGIERVIAGEK